MNQSNEIRLLVIADSHYAPGGKVGPDAPPNRLRAMGCELIRRAIEDAKLHGGFDAVALLGDLINDGREDYADQAVEEVLATVRQGAPDAEVMIAPGNHDWSGQVLPAGLGGRDKMFQLAGYRFIVFADPYVETMWGSRRDCDRRRLRELARRSGGPIVVLQHSPMNPYIDSSEYPFMLTNRSEVMRDYARAGVLLSISGHYHAGQPLNYSDGVAYFTSPAVGDAPFSYSLVTLGGREVGVEVRRLFLGDRSPLTDCHAHTEFAYCGSGVTAAGAIERAGVFGLAGVCLVEHAPQLYCTADDFWNARHLFDPSCWRGEGRWRMAEFRRRMAPLRDGFVRVGLEVEIDSEGGLVLHDADRDWADLLVGAVHWLPQDTAGLSDGQFAAAFMRTNEMLLARGVDILAHPWRIFNREHRAAPEHLYAPLASALAATNTAAEINFHTNRPDAAFFAACIERGVKIALGSDAHDPYECAALGPHLECLRRAAGRRDVAELLLY